MYKKEASSSANQQQLGSKAHCGIINLKENRLIVPQANNMYFLILL